jgi:uncharacterized protein
LIKVDIGTLPEGLSEVDMAAEASELDVEMECGRLESPVEINLEANRNVNEIRLKGRASVGAVLECGRCLAEYSLKLQSPIDLWCIIGGDTPAEDGCDRAENVMEVPVGTKYIDITDHLRSELLVLVPLKPLCENECKGLCPKCGANLNAAQCSCDTRNHDSRWDALNTLR